MKNLGFGICLFQAGTNLLFLQREIYLHCVQARTHTQDERG